MQVFLSLLTKKLTLRKTLGRNVAVLKQLSDDTLMPKMVHALMVALPIRKEQCQLHR